MTGVWTALVIKGVEKSDGWPPHRAGRPWDRPWRFRGPVWDVGPLAGDE